VDGGLNENGKRVQTYNNNGNNAQKWRIIQNYDGTYRIMPIISSTRALEVKSKSTGNNATIQIYDYSAGNHQKWVFESSYTLNTPLIPQEMSNWCWAASALMNARTLVPNTAVTQTNIVRHTFPNATNIDLQGNRQHQVNAARFATNNTVSYTCPNKALTLPELYSQLRAGHPVNVEIGFYSGTTRTNGHIIVVYGYTLDAFGLRFRAHDPSPVNQGVTMLMTYEQLVSNGNDQRWDSSIFAQ